MTIRKVVGLDFETYGSRDLTIVGLDNYLSDENFTPLIAAVVSDAGPPQIFDFVRDYEVSVEQLRKALDGCLIVAHNAAFEMGILKRIGIDIPSKMFVDSAVISRGYGSTSALANAAPQLLQSEKLASGSKLIKMFSVPGEHQSEDQLRFNPLQKEENLSDWKEFIRYCILDAQLGLSLYDKYVNNLSDRELKYFHLTHEMNERGWPVDLPAVREMKRKYEANKAAAEDTFRQSCDEWELNFGSSMQLKKWCEERGIRAKSFDEKNVQQLLKRIAKRIESDPNNTSQKFLNYREVLLMLETKQALGGSSLKKLDTILEMVSEDGRLRNQYMHAGAGQTMRTSGRGVQMQNLKRLGAEPADMASLHDPEVEWSNDELAENLRQVFTSSHQNGALIVGDFSSVESRGLAWLAGAEWKLDKYKKGLDMYKVMAADIFGIPYDHVLKSQRTFGKVGELSCGYGAGGPAVQSFAEGMGVDLTPTVAANLVKDWRSLNVEVVQLWKQLDDMLQALVDSGQSTIMQEQALLDGHSLIITRVPAPASLTHQRGERMYSLEVEIKLQSVVMMKRVFHGVHLKGRDIRFFKPSQRKTGQLWTDEYVDQKTGLTRHYSVYGGKLAGILTQSWCREIFFQRLEAVSWWVNGVSNVEVIGQFHDEIVLDWVPSDERDAVVLEAATSMMRTLMSSTRDMPSFPLAAEVYSDYRYIK